MDDESNMQDSIEKVEHLPHISGTVKLVALYNIIEKILHENYHQISVERERINP
jgi:hypothetical protein